MNKERYNQIIDEVYKSYVKSFFTGTLEENYTSNGENFDDYYTSIMEHQHLLGWPQDGPISKEEFINKCKTDPEFSEKWDLKIYERELSLEERNKWSWDNWGITCEMESVLDEQEIPKREITLTYNNEKIEIHE